VQYTYKVGWAICHNMKRSSVGPIFYKICLIEDVPLKKQYFNVIILAGFCTTIARCSGQYLTTYREPQWGLFIINKFN
jgi:hypothetical protein